MPDTTAPMTTLPRLCALALLAVLPPVLAQTLSLTKTADLNFGKLVPGTSSGSVSLSTLGVRSPSGGVTLFNQGSTHTAAAFTIANAPSNASCTLTWPTLPLIMSFNSSTLSVTTLTSSVGTSFQLAGTGGNFTVGGTATVNAQQPPGTYTNNGLTVEITCQ